MKQMKYRIYKRIAVLLVCRMKVHVGSEETWPMRISNVTHNHNTHCTNE